jgi:hypothetical protein
MLAYLKTAKKATSWQKLIKIHPFRVPIKVPCLEAPLVRQEAETDGELKNHNKILNMVYIKIIFISNFYLPFVEFCRYIERS